MRSDAFLLRACLTPTAKGFHVEKMQSPKPRTYGTVRGAGGLHDRGRNVFPLDRRRTSELATLWPKLSVSEIVKRMHRPRWAIRSKAKRLRLDGMRAHNPSEDVEAVNPPKRRWGWRTAGAEADGRK